VNGSRPARRRAEPGRVTGPADAPATGAKPGPQPPGSPDRSASWILPVTLALAALCLLGLFSTELTDTDFWWHLKAGQYIVQKHTLPVPDPFAYTTALGSAAYPGEEQVRHFNLTHEWLAQALLYIVYVMGGIPAVVLMRAALLAGICGLTGLVAFRRAENIYAGIAPAAATASVAVVFTADRPALVTFLLAGVFIAILEFRRGVWFLPLLGLLWANSHGGFFLGWVVLGAYCAETIPVWRRVLPGRPLPQDRKQIWIVTAATIALSLLNPNGFGVLATLLKYRGSTMQTSLLEWQAPYLWGPPYAFDLLLYAATAVLIISWRKVRIADWILFAACAAASLTAFRNILLIGMVAPVLIASYFPWKLRLPPKVEAKYARFAVPALLAIALTFGTVRGSFFQLRAASWTFPSGAADYILANHITGPLFNSYEHGGYLMWRLWPQERIFIDGRSLSESTFRDYRQILYNPSAGADQMAGPRVELLNRYGIDVIVTNTFEYASGSFYPLAMALAGPGGADWQLVYDDAQSLIFLRRSAATTPVFADKAKRVFDHMETECTTHIEHAPGTPMCARTLADFWMRAGDKPRALGLLTLYLSHATERDENAERALRALRSR